MRNHLAFWIPALFAMATVMGKATPLLAQQPPSDPEKFHIYLLAGQSNMAGRGVVEAQDSVIHPRVWMLNQDLRWVPAVEPIHFDKPQVGTGLGRSFGIAMAEADPTVHIGLVPTAVGGSPITAWVPGGLYPETGAYPWDEAIGRTATAMERGTLKAILWHQGESDSGEAASLLYADRLRSLISRFRERLHAPEVPFLIGQLGRFEGAPWTPGTTRVDSIHQAIAAEVPNAAYVSAEGLDDKGDNLHFNSAAYREFGLRYAEAYRALLRRSGSTQASQTPTVPR